MLIFAVLFENHINPRPRIRVNLNLRLGSYKTFLSLGIHVRFEDLPDSDKRHAHVCQMPKLACLSQHLTEKLIANEADLRLIIPTHGFLDK